MATLNTYLIFNGDCDSAFELYRTVFNGEILQLSRFKDMPGDKMAPEEADMILHVSLRIGEDSILMGSDTPQSQNQPVTPGTNVSISVNASSKDEADAIFTGLAAGGTASMPMEDTFWGAYFGMLQDRYGVNWMVNYDYPHEQPS
jgi:PhnB protein